MEQEEYLDSLPDVLAEIQETCDWHCRGCKFHAACNQLKKLVEKRNNATNNGKEYCGGFEQLELFADEP